MCKNKQIVQLPVMRAQGSHDHVKEHSTCKNNFKNLSEKGES